jgi:hypothetical protein
LHRLDSLRLALFRCTSHSSESAIRRATAGSFWLISKPQAADIERLSQIRPSLRPFPARKISGALFCSNQGLRTRSPVWRNYDEHLTKLALFWKCLGIWPLRGTSVRSRASITAVELEPVGWSFAFISSGRQA